MALFTRADDAGVPLLTRLVQLKTIREGHLALDPGEAAWFLWWAQTGEAQQFVGLAVVRDFFREWQFERDDKRDPYDAAIADLTELRRVALGIMEDFADSADGQMSWGNHLAYSMVVPKHILGAMMPTDPEGRQIAAPRDPLGEIDQQARFPRRLLERSFWGLGTKAVIGVAYAIDELLNDPDAVCRRCPECDFPFVQARVFQTFCSQRCRTRNSVRKNRQKKKTEKVAA